MLDLFDFFSVSGLTSYSNFFGSDSNFYSDYNRTTYFILLNSSSNTFRRGLGLF